MIGRWSSKSNKTAGVVVRAALTALLAFRLVILPAVVSANPAPQTDPNLLPICTVYGLYYLDLRTGEKITPEDDHQSPKTDDCTFCHAVCHASVLHPTDNETLHALLAGNSKGAWPIGLQVNSHETNSPFDTRAPPAA